MYRNLRKLHSIAVDLVSFQRRRCHSLLLHYHYYHIVISLPPERLSTVEKKEIQYGVAAAINGFTLSFLVMLHVYTRSHTVAPYERTEYIEY